MVEPSETVKPSVSIIKEESTEETSKTDLSVDISLEKSTASGENTVQDGVSDKSIEDISREATERSVTVSLQHTETVSTVQTLTHKEKTNIGDDQSRNKTDINVDIEKISASKTLPNTTKSGIKHTLPKLPDKGKLPKLPKIEGYGPPPDLPPGVSSDLPAFIGDKINPDKLPEYSDLPPLPDTVPNLPDKDSLPKLSAHPFLPDVKDSMKLSKTPVEDLVHMYPTDENTKLSNDDISNSDGKSYSMNTMNEDLGNPQPRRISESIINDLAQKTENSVDNRANLKWPVGNLTAVMSEFGEVVKKEDMPVFTSVDEPRHKEGIYRWEPSSWTEVSFLKNIFILSIT